ncbi:nucleoside phosphatase [Raphidocelis subcapitata]|uniref:Nucleoside phosphatase n=1 Tax=Raphidocelis subcapitata TaxID=307507 RepID=A0A2V0PQC3_9CHLO|nr:nucleoside phosphatase [Raphidocelis subcapitata]|eukprot:GBF99405.1 nucleoside phosphatase [Raphidocelis subcapitata]
MQRPRSMTAVAAAEHAGALQHPHADAVAAAAAAAAAGARADAALPSAAAAAGAGQAAGGGGGGAGGGGGGDARQLPVSTRTLHQIAAGLLLGSASRGGGAKGPADELYSAAKASDVPLAKLLRRRWFAARTAVASRPRAAAAALLLLALLLAAAALAARGAARRRAGAAGYVVFLDAGSTGTRAHVFRYEPPRRRPGAGHDAYARIALPEPKLKVEPGLSAHASDPAAAAASLRPLLDFARAHVPPAARGATPVRLMATAGLRLLPRAGVEAVLDACRAEIAASGFLFRPEWAEVISGRAEGLFAWMAANYASGALEAAALQAAVARKSPRDWAQFSGLLELGGASAQVTFLLADREQLRGEQGGRDGGPDGEGGGGEGWPAGAPRQQQQQQQQQGQQGQQGQQQQQQVLEQDQLQVQQRRHGFAGDGAAGGGGGSGEQQLSARAKRKRRRHVQLQLPGVSKRLFTHSFLGYGFDVLEAKLAAQALAEARGGGGGGGGGGDGSPSGGDSSGGGGGGTATDPCLPKGYESADGRLGTGDWRACQRRVAATMDPEGCARRGGGGGGGGGAGGAGGTGGACPEFPDSLPPLPPTLVAIENFYYTAQALSLPARADLHTLESAAAGFCGREWPDTVAAYGAAAEGLDAPSLAVHLRQGRYLWRYCFGSALVWTLLHDVLRVPKVQPLVFANALPRGGGGGGGEVGLDWALGAALCSLTECTRREGAEPSEALPSLSVDGGGGGAAAAGAAPAVRGAAALALGAAVLAAAAAAAWRLRRRAPSGRPLRGDGAAAAAALAGAALPPRGPPPRGRPSSVLGSFRRGAQLGSFGSRRQLVLTVGAGSGGSSERDESE